MNKGRVLLVIVTTFCSKDPAASFFHMWYKTTTVCVIRVLFFTGTVFWLYFSRLTRGSFGRPSCLPHFVLLSSVLLYFCPTRCCLDQKDLCLCIFFFFGVFFWVHLCKSSYPLLGQKRAEPWTCDILELPELTAGFPVINNSPGSYDFLQLYTHAFNTTSCKKICCTLHYFHTEQHTVLCMNLAAIPYI